MSLERSLIDRFDAHIREKGYSNRSEAIRDLIRGELVASRWQQGGTVAGAITLIYNHHQRELGYKLTDIQHHFQNSIISTQHIHLDAENCMEILAVRGDATHIKMLAETLEAVKGVMHVTVNMSGTGGELG
jgi:CopG family nickel-responsive transcriptional regulator